MNNKVSDLWWGIVATIVGVLIPLAIYGIFWLIFHYLFIALIVVLSIIALVFYVIIVSNLYDIRKIESYTITDREKKAGKREEYIGLIAEKHDLRQAAIANYAGHGVVWFNLPFEGKLNQRVKITFELLEDEK